MHELNKQRQQEITRQRKYHTLLEFRRKATQWKNGGNTERTVVESAEKENQWVIDKICLTSMETEVRRSIDLRD